MKNKTDISESNERLAFEPVLPPVRLTAAWKNEYSKVWEDGEDIKYHLAKNESVLCGMDKREGGLWHFGEEIAKEGNDFYLCKNCLKIAKAKRWW